MTEFEAAAHAEVRSRRLRASVTMAVSVTVDPAPRRRTPVPGWTPAGLTDPDVRWDVLPDRIRPEDWVTEQTDPAVPGSIMALGDVEQDRVIRYGG